MTDGLCERSPKKLCQIFCSRSKKLRGSLGDMRGRQKEGVLYWASFWRLCQRLDLVVVGRQRPWESCFQKKRGGLCFLKVSLFPLLSPHQFSPRIISVVLSDAPAAS